MFSFFMLLRKIIINYKSAKKTWPTGLGLQLVLINYLYTQCTGTTGKYKMMSELSLSTVSKPAPHWEGTAVVNGEFKELKITDFKGKLAAKVDPNNLFI